MARASAPAADPIDHHDGRGPGRAQPAPAASTHRRARRRAHRHRLSGAASVSDSPAAASRSPRQPADRCDPISAPPRVVGADQAPSGSMKSWRSNAAWRRRNSRKGCARIAGQSDPSPRLRNAYIAETALREALRSAGLLSNTATNQTKPRKPRLFNKLSFCGLGVRAGPYRAEIRDERAAPAFRASAFPAEGRARGPGDRMASYQYVYVMRRLTKIFPGGKKVLEDITLAFLPGAKIGVLGVNGAGKSTPAHHGRARSRLLGRGGRRTARASASCRRSRSSIPPRTCSATSWRASPRPRRCSTASTRCRRSSGSGRRAGR